MVERNEGYLQRNCLCLYGGRQFDAVSVARYLWQRVTVLTLCYLVCYLISFLFLWHKEGKNLQHLKEQMDHGALMMVIGHHSEWKQGSI